MFYRFNQKDFEEVINHGLLKLIQFHLLQNCPSRETEIMALSVKNAEGLGNEMILEENLTLLNTLHRKRVIDSVYEYMLQKITTKMIKIKETKGNKKKALAELQHDFLLLSNEFVVQPDDLLRRYWRHEDSHDGYLHFNTFDVLIYFEGLQIRRISDDTFTKENMRGLSHEMLAFCNPKKLQENNFNGNVNDLLIECDNNNTFDLENNSRYYDFLSHDKKCKDFPGVVKFFETVITYLEDKKSVEVFDNLQNLFCVSLHGKSSSGEVLPKLPKDMLKLIYEFL